MSLNWSSQQLEAHLLTGIDQVEEYLTSSLQDPNDLLTDLVQHLSRAGGKRMRPALVMLCAHLGPAGVSEDGAFSKQIMKAALVVELTHLATLYHDDVMDSAPTRRGVPSAQRVWGNNRAVLAGDLVFARASQLVADLGPAAVKEHAATFERLCRGQINESFGPSEGEDPVAFYLQVLADKTGSLVAQSARFGASLSQASAQVAAQVAQFGDQVGVAFQLVDDVIDLDSEGEVSGKTPGTDLREGVVTLPTLLLEQQEKAGQLDSVGETILARWRHPQQLQDQQLLSETVQLLRSHPVLDQTRQTALEWANRAKSAIASLEQAAVKSALEQFADSLVDRIA